MSHFKRVSFVTGSLWLCAALLLVTATGCNDDSTSPRSETATGSDGDNKPAADPIVDAPADQDQKDAQDDSSKTNEAADASTREQAGTGNKATRGSAAANTELWSASAQGHVTDAKAALAQGANVHARDENGNTALMLAAYDGHEKVAKLLIDNGAEVNATNPAGRTPLMFAATFDSPGTVQLLLVNGALVNVRDNGEKWTALMFAAAEGHLGNVKLLLTHSANKTLVDIDGETAADFARANKRMKVVELLE